jgi:hypothetical protein
MKTVGHINIYINSFDDVFKLSALFQENFNKTFSLIIFPSFKEETMDIFKEILDYYNNKKLIETQQKLFKHLIFVY